MRTFKTRWFTRFARREGISDEALREAIERAERGLVDADLGGGLIKQRVARPGAGRSGGYRTIIAFRTNDRAIFISGFPKNEQENIGPDELKTLREISLDLLGAMQDSLDEAAAAGRLTEIPYD
jgi:hypothetical protein